jgi:hypothetical protein
MTKILNSIILTVQPTGVNWRLGLSAEDSVRYFSHMESVRFFLTKQLIVECNAACGTSKKKKAFDFNKMQLSEWLTCNNFHIYPKRKPTRLIFKFALNSKGKVLTFDKMKTSP